jgi:hypothetical protein
MMEEAQRGVDRVRIIWGRYRRKREVMILMIWKKMIGKKLL